MPYLKGRSSMEMKLEKFAELIKSWKQKVRELKCFTSTKKIMLPCCHSKFQIPIIMLLIFQEAAFGSAERQTNG
jgi:hypothetical protein